MLLAFECNTSGTSTLVGVGLFNVVKYITYSNDDCTEGGTAVFYEDFGDISSAEICPDETQCIES